MEPVLVLLCLSLARAAAAATAGRGVATRPVVLPLRLRVQEAANRVRFRRSVSLTVPVAVGTPPQGATMVLDTGSELSCLLCNATTSAPPPRLFNASASSTYRAVPCASPDCRWRGRDLPVRPSCAARSGSCRDSLSYADGVLAADTFALGESSPPAPALFGCVASYSSTSPSEEPATGLLGMNRGALSFVTQTGIRRFASCIAPGAGPGLLVLGGDAAPTLVEVALPLPYFDRAAYSVHLEGIRVGASLLPIPESRLAPDHTGYGQTMLDSGTQFTFLLGDAYAALKREFTSQARALLAPLDQPDFVFQGAFDACFRAPEAGMAETSRMLPEIGLVLRGAEVAVAGDKLLYMVPGAEAVWCLTFGNADLAGVSAYVIGHHHQQDLWVEYDIQNGRVGIAPARCDAAAQRLGATGALAGFGLGTWTTYSTAKSLVEIEY